MENQEIASILTEIGVILEIKGENPFKTRAYTYAARTIENLETPLKDIVAAGKLNEIKGIGSSLGQKLTELVETGTMSFYNELRGSIAPGLFDLLQVPTLGPKKVKALYSQLGVSSIVDLEKACNEGKVATLSGFGEKTQAKILEGIKFKQQYASKFLLGDARLLADPLLAALQSHPLTIRCSTAGSLRRSKEVVGDIDFVVSSTEPTAVIEFFIAQPVVEKILVKGDTKTSVILTGGLQADLRVVTDTEYPFTVNYFTGSKEHNIVMRQRAIQKGLRLNEYGLFQSKTETRDPALRVPCSSEGELYQLLDLTYIEPELREDRGEFTASEKNELPALIQQGQVLGSLHNHSNWSDGNHTIPEIADYMSKAGFSYWGITDHSKASFQANGLSVERLMEQRVVIQQTNKRLEDQGADFRLLHGAEVDILKTGLDYDDDVLSQLDIVVASLHVQANDEAENTKRLIAAATNPYVHMIGHMSGRLLLMREPYKINQEAVIDACAATGTWIELNATPQRLDLDWRLWHMAQRKGVKCVINCDAHHNKAAEYLKLGISVARKGWLTASDIINTVPLPQLQAALKQKQIRNSL
jgi:DNA polymerase (family 10)